MVKKDYYIICYIYLSWKIPQTSTEFQNLLKVSICMEKKILVSAGLFSKVPVPSMTMYF